MKINRQSYDITPEAFYVLEIFLGILSKLYLLWTTRLKPISKIDPPGEGDFLAYTASDPKKEAKKRKNLI